MPKTKDTISLADIPAGRDPAEFLKDEDLAKFYERELAALPADDEGRPALIAKVRAARISAAITSPIE